MAAMKLLGFAWQYKSFRLLLLVNILLNLWAFVADEMPQASYASFTEQELCQTSGCSCAPDELAGLEGPIQLLLAGVEVDGFYIDFSEESFDSPAVTPFEFFASQISQRGFLSQDHSRAPPQA